MVLVSNETLLECLGAFAACTYSSKNVAVVDEVAGFNLADL
jgi:hypothetical protein